ncbi:hypothetical protein PEC730217_09310 [Pectobacterium carotovorum subsp. carotovorum]|nr:hypothetical protein PEC730217_09310 [Pectobacterium carotovorum subsp. carotovorum]
MMFINGPIWIRVNQESVMSKRILTWLIIKQRRMLSGLKSNKLN